MTAVANERKREDVEQFVDRFMGTLPEGRDGLYHTLSAITGVSEKDLRAILEPVETSRDYLIERIQLLEGGDLKRDREALTLLVQCVIDGEGSTAQMDEWLRVIAANISAPISYVIGLIFEATTVPQARDVVEKALAYRPPDAILL
jgi:hypothetical protein